MITEQDITNWFTHHPPGTEDAGKYLAIREAGLNMAKVVLENTPSSADQSDAIRSIRNAVMTANAAIACK